MSTECTHDCSSCSSNCSSREQTESLLAQAGEGTKIKKIIAVVSGKGGVGKSLVTSLLAVAAKKAGKKTAIVDADITGPSIPRIFGITDKAEGVELGILPVKSESGIDTISINSLLEDETAPVVWRGPVIAGTVKQFYTDVVWGNVDIMFIDMPPGTGDVPLTVFQSIPIDGIVIVTSPQSLVSMIVEKAVKMAEIMKIPILGIVENYAYLNCPDCNKKIEVFGESRTDAVAQKYGIPVLAKLPIDPNYASLCDKGRIEDADTEPVDNIIKLLG